MHQVSITIEDERYIDQLIVALVRQGLECYLSFDKTEICFTTDEVFEIKEQPWSTNKS